MAEPGEPHETEGESPGIDAPMRAAIYSVAGFGLIFGMVAVALVDVRMGIGVSIGGAIATVNLLVFARIGQAFVTRGESTAPWALVAVLKLVLLFSGVWLILKSGLVSGLSLAAGYAALPFGVTFASLFGPKARGGDLPPTTSSRRDRDVIKPPRHGSSDPGSEP